MRNFTPGDATAGKRLLLMLFALILSPRCGAAEPWVEFDDAVIVFGGDASYPPFEWREDGTVTGLNVDLQLAIAEVGGVRAEHRLGNWPDVIGGLKAGSIDVVAMFRSKEREGEFRFTRAVSFVNHSIYGLSDAANVASVDDLSTARVAVEELSYAHKRLVEMDHPAQVVLAPNTVAALEAVLDKRADYAVLSEPAANYLIHSRQMALRSIGSPLWPTEYALAVRKDRPALARWLDEQLAIVVESGRYRDIEASWKSRWEPPTLASRWLILGVPPLVAAMLLAGWWAWSLRRTLVEHTRRLLDESRLRTDAESKLNWAADHYSDTGMPKRHHFVRLAEQFISENRGRGCKQAVVALRLADLDRTIRTHGHEAGLDAVRKFAERLGVSGFPAYGQMGRGTFAIFGEKGRIESELRDVLVSSETATMMAPHPRMFAGAAIRPQHGTDLSELLRKAESALSRAVERRAGWVEFRPFMEPSADELRLVSLFRELGAGVIHPVFQPQIDLATGEIIGAEALARWELAGTGQVSPGVFIPLLEDAGLVSHVTRRMVREAVRVAAGLRKIGCPCPVSVNVTGNDLMGWKLSRGILNALREYGGIAADLKLELTETNVIDRPEILQWKMRRLIKEGFRLSVDDFGTGYSSLIHLKDFPVQELKIDQSFVRDMLRDSKDMSIVTSTIDMAHELDLVVVAEGVETEEVLDVLRRHGCDRVQGYLVSRPLAEADFIEFVTRNASSGELRKAHRSSE